MSTAQICPSILAADFLKLHEQVQVVERGGAERFQIDVMDGVFVPNISFGVPLVEAMRMCRWAGRSQAASCTPGATSA